MEEKILNIEEKIKSKIRAGEIKMKPKWYFVLKAILIFTFILILFLSIIYIWNFVGLIFHERNEARDLVKEFTPENFFLFIKAFPWLLFTLILIFLFTLYRLVSKYSFVYKRPFIYSIFFILILIIAIIINIRIFDKGFKIAKFGEKGEASFLKDIHMRYRPEAFIKLPPREKEILKNPPSSMFQKQPY